MINFDVISPDGIPIDFEPYNTEADARTGFKTWVRRFEMQGYYSSNNGRIRLADLKSSCKLVKYDDGKQVPCNSL